MSEQRNQAWINAMPWLFVLIWSTGFIVARYGMPNSPPFTFLLWRYIFSILCFVLWVKWARVLGRRVGCSGGIWQSRAC